MLVPTRTKFSSIQYTPRMPLALLTREASWDKVCLPVDLPTKTRWLPF